MFRFANSEFLYLLLVIPLIVLVFVYSRIWRKKAIEKFGNTTLISSLMPEVSKTKPILKFILIVLAYTCLVFTLAGPQFGTKIQEAKRKGIELILAIDVSNSMMATDVQPSRMERAKQAISKMVDKLQNDKIGLVVFAGQAYTQLPITTDYVSAKLFLSTIGPDIVPVQGTAIGAAIDLAASSFDETAEMSKVIVVITDGENHEDDAVGAAEKAAEKGINVYTIGIGSPAGSPIPIGDNPTNQDYRRDESGNFIMSKLNEPLLAQIAAAGKGKYYFAAESDLGLNKVIDEIGKKDKKEIDAKIYTDFDDQFQYIAAIVMFLLIIEVLIREKKYKWFEKLKLFSK